MFTPTKEEFVELAKTGNLIPVFREILADTETPVTAYQKLHVKGSSFLLESVVGGENVGRHSFVGVNPRKIIRVESLNEQDPLYLVEQELAQYRSVKLPGLPGFSGGAVGFLGYEYIHAVEKTVPCPAKNDLGTPVMCFMVTDSLLIFDHVSQTIKVVVNAHVNGPAEEAYNKACDAINFIIARLKSSLVVAPVDFNRNIAPLKFGSNMMPAQHAQIVGRAKEYMEAGDIIQVVLSQRFMTQCQTSALNVYRALRSVNPSPYMFLLNFEDFQLVGASPEVHVKCNDGYVQIRPIAGTRWRGANEEEDARLKLDLLGDEKERAEHIMLVDLARNDIGRVCDFGSVQVTDGQFMIVEKYSHVMHIVSNVTGQLSPRFSIYDLMRATFPAGTVSGAPKIRAMQIIAELEKTQRGPYAGAVCHFSFTGNLDSCITLRTALLKDGFAYVQAGGGIVADSNPETEFNETVDKAKGMLKALASAKSFAAV